MTGHGATARSRPSRPPRRRAAVALAALALLAGLAGALEPAAADDRRNALHPRHSGPGSRAPFSGGGPFKVPSPVHQGAKPRDHDRRAHQHGHRGFVAFANPVGVLGYGWGLYAPPAYAPAPPDYAYAPGPVISVAPVFYNAPQVYYASPGPPAPTAPEPVAIEPRPSVIEYETGRHELRGDGITTPHVWVWVPNPPPPPARAVAAPEPPARASNPGSGTPAPRSRLYRWTDGQGVVHLTNHLDAIPDEHRAEAQRAR